jgi:hypothetical protein
MLHERAASKVLLAGLPNDEWDDLNQFRKRVSGREVAVARNEHPPDNKHGRVAGLGSRGAFAD